MKEPESILQAQVGSMLELLEKSSRAHCVEVEGQAANESRKLVARARREARERVAKAVRTQRQTNGSEIRAARAEIATEARARLWVRDQRRLERGWTALDEALTRRWAEPELRRRWVLDVARRAAEVLPPDGWTIHHPRTLDAADRAALGEALAARGIESPRWGSAQLQAGVRIERGSVRVDGTPRGLLVDRAERGARFLAVVHAMREARS
jgi:hypothetical protein